MKTLSDILAYTKIYPDLTIINNLQIKHISLDSRFNGGNWLFLAYQGIRSNGNNYIESAISNGAIAILTDQQSVCEQNYGIPIFYSEQLKGNIPDLANWFYDSPSKNLKVIAVTGTNGKTSVSHLYAQLGTLLGCKTATLGTIGNGIWPKIDTSTHTTPDPVSLQRLFIQFYEHNAEQIIIEASSHALEQNRLSALNIHTAIWTNLSHDHLDYHGDMQHYFEAKAKLFNFQTLQTAIINLDDHYAPILINKLKDKPLSILTYSLKNPQADLYVTDHKPTQNGYLASFIYQKNHYEICTPLMGKFNLYNLAATLLALIKNGFTLEDIIPKISRIQPVTGRMQQLTHHKFTTIVIDYAHTPDALENALLTARAHVKNKLWCIFGCGGDRDKTKRPKMAAIAEKLADKVIITEDNNRTENFENILKGIQSGFQHPSQHIHISDRTEAIHLAIDQANTDDLILLCGKGHERYMDKNGKKTSYNEEEIIESYWSQKI